MVKYRRTYKIILLGDATVGKTAIKSRYLGHGFKGDYTVTVGVDFHVKRITLDDTLYVIQIWDLAGQDGFTKFRSNYYEGASGSLLVFDISNKLSFQNLSKWLDEMQDNIGGFIPLLLIGNKIDLRDKNEDCISNEEVIAFLKAANNRMKININYVETSALKDINIEKSFLSLLKLIEKNSSDYTSHS